jgi:hypothetical protein
VRWTRPHAGDGNCATFPSGPHPTPRKLPGCMTEAVPKEPTLLINSKNENRQQRFKRLRHCTKYIKCVCRQIRHRALRPQSGRQVRARTVTSRPHHALHCSSPPRRASCWPLHHEALAPLLHTLQLTFLQTKQLRVQAAQGQVSTHLQQERSV